MPQHEASGPNPWLTIPWQDYEGHMSHPAVKQSQFLSEVFRGAIRKYEPESLVALGCATGNGFEHIDPKVSRRVVAVDINHRYLSILQDRFRSLIPGLECICDDVVKCELEAEGYDLAHCALIFEYLEPSSLIKRIERWLRPGGVLVVVLQLPSPNSVKVTKTQFKSLKRLETIMRLVKPGHLKRLLDEVGFVERLAYTENLDSMKEFYVGHYRKL
jgi:ubiquinone/menaquinone biosynthesis C-methylase UbiE